MAVLISTFSLSACVTNYGLVESNFQLAVESRLPKWFETLSIYPREDLSIYITVFSSRSGGKAKMIVYGPPPERKKLMEKIGPYRRHPLTEQQGYMVYPRYSIIDVDGVEEVFEQRRMDDILYVTDDPKVTSVLHRK